MQEIVSDKVAKELSPGIMAGPKGESVYDFIPTEFSSVQYTRIQDAILGIKQLKSPCYMTNSDVEIAYRNLPFSSTDYLIFGFK